MKRKKQLIACVMASVMAAGFLQATPPVFADELTSESQHPEECIETTEVTETYTESETVESSVVNDEVIEPSTVNLETTDEEVVSDITEEVETTDITVAENPDEYFNLVSELPSAERVIVDTTDDLNGLDISAGVYYDGTYILCFDSHDSLSETVETLYDDGYEYDIDGILGICGRREGVISYAGINPDASVRVAVIDTGSDLANEKYSVIGDDPDDHNGHGTAVCSYILDETDNAYIISIKAMGDNGQGYMSDVYAAVQMAENMNVDYILMAVSIMDCGKYDLFKSLIENTNSTIVASAGNNGTDACYYIPAGLNGVITVGAINEDGTLNESSNYGDSVEYYAVADSTSEAAAKALGMILSGRDSELATDYIVPEPDNLFHLVFRAEDDEVMFDTDSTWAGDNIYVYHKDDHIDMVDMIANSGYWSRCFYYADTEPEGNKYQQSYYDKALYCIQDSRPSPDNVDYQAYTYLDGIDRDSRKYQMIQAAGAFGPGGALYEYGLAWWKAHDPNDEMLLIKDASSMYIVTHYAMDWYYSNETTEWPGNQGFGVLLHEYMDYIYGVRTGTINIPGLTLTNWWCEIYQTTWNGSYQDMAHGDVTATPVQITVAKSSSNPAITNSNSCYSLAGTKYGLYKTSDNSLVHTFEINESGTTSAYTLDPLNDGGDLYIKEISAGKGYKLDTNRYPVYLGSASNNLVTVTLNDVALSSSASVQLVKQDEGGWNLITGRELSGAVFRIDYFDRTDIRSTADIALLDSVTPKASVSLVSTNNGSITININTLSSADKNGYFSTINALPLGTYRISEVSAPSGYLKADKPLVIRITDNGGSAKLDYVYDSSIYKLAANNGIVLNEKAKTGFYAPLKSSTDNSSLIDGVHSLNGTKYGIYYKANDMLVCTLIFNDEGNISAVDYNSQIKPYVMWKQGDKEIELAEGDYYAKELSAGRWFFVDDSIHEFSVTASSSSDMNFEDKPLQPQISTNATDADTGNHYMSYKERVTIIDVVTFEDLIPDEEYTITGTIYNVKTGEIYTDAEGITYTKTVTFTPDSSNALISNGTASGSVTVEFENVLVSYEEISLVVFERLYEEQNNMLIAVHEDINDEDQTVIRRVPEIKTTATDSASGTHVFVYEERVSINDVVTYTNLNPGEEYYLTGTLYDADTGEIYKDIEGKTYTVSKTFMAATEDGEEIIEFKDVLIPLTKTSIVVFEELHEASEGALIVSHADLADEDQTVRRASCVTYATTLRGAKSFSNDSVVTVVDHVSYENLEAGQTYYAKASLFTASGDAVLDNGVEVSAVQEFVPDSDTGIVEVPIEFDPATLTGGERVVVVENIYDKQTVDEMTAGVQKEDIHILEHADLNNMEQSLHVTDNPPVKDNPPIPDTPITYIPQLGELPQNELVICLGVSLVVIGAVSLVIATEIRKNRIHKS